MYCTPRNKIFIGQSLEKNFPSNGFLSLSDIGGNLICLIIWQSDMDLLKVFKLQIVMFYAIICLPLHAERYTLRFRGGSVQYDFSILTQTVYNILL